MSSVTPDTVRERRDREQIMAGLHARKFTGEETLKFGIELSNFAIRMSRRKPIEQ